MSLIGDPWIPVVFDGAGPTPPEARLVGLDELYRRAEEIRDLALSPPQRIAVMRLLLCITHAALDGPEDEDDWRTCRERIVSKSLAYLESRCDRFELFGERPFLQVKDLKLTLKMTLDKLDVGLAAGNNATLFDQAAYPHGRQHEPGWIALQLLTFLNYAGSHKVTENRWGGQPTGANGVCYAELPAFRETMATVIPTKEPAKNPYQYLAVDLDRHPWRELFAILEMRKIGVVGGPPALRHLLKTHLAECDLWIGGVQPLKAGEYRDMGEWIFRIPVKLLHTNCVGAYTQGAKTASRGSKRLHEAVKTYYEHLVVTKDKTKPRTSVAKRGGREARSNEAERFTSKTKVLYWSFLDACYETLIELATQQAGLAPWTAQCRKAMRDAYIQTCAAGLARRPNTAPGPGWPGGAT
jgi:hypothetical protein